jgi:hypothetical protein
MRNWLMPLALVIPLLANGCAPSSHDEASDGDLSNDPAAPTVLRFSVGENLVSGTVTAPADTRDFITFQIPRGLELSGLWLLRYRDGATGGPGNVGFHALKAGATSAVPGAATAGSFLGGDHLEGGDEGKDLLPALADGTPAGTGFPVPLGPGTYSYVIQQTGPQVSAYTLEFDVSVGVDVNLP